MSVHRPERHIEHGKKQKYLVLRWRLPLCSAEMAQLEKYKSEALCLVDIHSASLAEDQLPEGKSREELLRLLHLQTADGRWLIGVDANVAAWSHTRFGCLWRVLRWPQVASLADRVYALWARKRYAKRYGALPHQ